MAIYMKNEKISHALKLYRKQNNLTVTQVSEMLSSQNITVAEKTIYGWESGQAQPDADTLLRLCKIYHIDDVLSTFGYEQEQATLIQPTLFELELIRQYRAHPQHQSAILKLLDME